MANKKLIMFGLIVILFLQTIASANAAIDKCEECYSQCYHPNGTRRNFGYDWGAIEICISCYNYNDEQGTTMCPRP